MGLMNKSLKGHSLNIKQTRCKRCGQCCYLVLGDKVKKCKWLLKLGNGIYHCRIYVHQSRFKVSIGEIDGKKFYCVPRELSPYDFKGCPYNSNKEIREVKSDEGN